MNREFTAEFLKEYVLLTCVDCGDTMRIPHSEFEEMVQNGLIDLAEEIDDEPCNCDFCKFIEEEDEFNIFEHLEEMRQEMVYLLDEERYEEHLLVAEAYAVLLSTIE